MKFVAVLGLSVLFVTAVGAQTPKKIKRKSATPSTISSSSGADSESGWVLRRNADGTVVKVPRKQTFTFNAEVEGQVSRPTQAIEGTRPSARQNSLIPVRQSFREDVLGTVGFKSPGQ